MITCNITAIEGKHVVFHVQLEERAGKFVYWPLPRKDMCELTFAQATMHYVDKRIEQCLTTTPTEEDPTTLDIARTAVAL